MESRGNGSEGANMHGVGGTAGVVADRLRSEGDINMSALRREWAERNVSDEARKWLELDAKYFLHQSLSTPCLNVLHRCEGGYIEDVTGKRYMDLHGNNVHNVGFSHPAVIEALKRQLDEFAFCPRRYTNKEAVLLAEKLGEIAPGDLSKCLFCPGGTEAVEIALKLARGYTKRYKTVSWWDSFHGASLLSISVGGEQIFRGGEIGPLVGGTEHVPPPTCYRCPFGYEGPEKCGFQCARLVEYVLEKEGDVSAVIAEPVRSIPYIPPPEYWQIVRNACDKYGTLLIFDEIPSGLGRTGKMFACQHYGVVPDVLVLGKPLGGGVVPFAGIIAREHLDVMGHRALGHYTHEKSPLLCTVALVTIQLLEDGLVDNAVHLGEYALKLMTEMKDRHPLIGDVRGKGLLLGIELVKDRQSKERATVEAETVMYRAMEKGLSFKLTMGNIITLTPALVITKEEMQRALSIIDDVLTELEKG